MEAHNFTGGEKLQAKLAEISSKVNKKATLRVGFLEGATYPVGSSGAKGARKFVKKKKAAAPSGPKLVAMIAAIQEFGAPSRGIPPRPYFRRMIRQRSPAWGSKLGKALKANAFEVDQSLGLMGQLIKGQLQQSINELVSPPLSPVTVARKGFSKPLIDTGHMLNSVDYDIRT